MIRILPLLILLTACGGSGGDSPSPPAAGSVLGTSCEEYKLIETVADGKGGSTIVETERSPQCGWNPPEEGSVVETSCEDYTLIEQIADGEYGTTEQRTERSPECGWDPPASGTILSSSCDEYLLIEEIADGEYGSFVRETGRSPECGWDPPEAGTVVEAYCDGFDFVEVLNDGEYGTYEEIDENNVEQCDYVPPRLTPVKETGDRFDPVVFAYDGTAEDPTIEVEIGIVRKVGSEVHVYGDGQIGEGTLLLEGTEEYRYTIAEEPRCAREEGLPYDCQNYTVSSNHLEKGYIYYGEEDERVVEWEIAFVWYVSEPSFGPTEPGGSHQNVITRHEVGSSQWNEAEQLMAKYQTAYDRSGIHVKFVLKEGHVVDAHYHLNGNQSILKDDLDADVYIAFGNTCEDACGCAQPITKFEENEAGKIPSGTSVCGWDTDLHEIGHAVGLAHGPENSYNKASGYIWPDFGHGWDAFCGNYADIMSYEITTVAHHNSKLICSEMYSDKITNYILSTNAAGSREYADAAYHINRVRYDVSLIHCGDICKVDVAQRSARPTPDIPIVVDKIDQFENGQGRRERFMRNNPRYKNTPTIHKH
jgi:hypothetical protein